MITSTIRSAMFGITLALSTYLSAAPAVAADKAVELLPAGTVIKLIPTGSGGLIGMHSIGDSIAFIVKDPIIINGWVVIPKGAPAQGVITDITVPAKSSFFSDRISQGSMHYAFAWVQLDAGKIKLDDTPVEMKGRQIASKRKNRDTAYGLDPTISGVEDGIDAKTLTSVHVPTTLRATAIQQAQQTNNYLDK